MNENLKSVLVSYGNKEHQSRLENYISERRGEKVSFGKMDYDGKGTILIISLDLRKISHTNVTGAIWFPGKRFRGEIDEFIQWHSRISEMGYLQALEEAEEKEDVIALFYEEAKDRFSYICFRMSDRLSIENYLISCDGKALSFENGDRKYWLLSGMDNGNRILFSRTEYPDKPYGNIRSDLRDLEFFRYLVMM